jgi:adenine-specific DNA-methyltransferase
VAYLLEYLSMNDKKQKLELTWIGKGEQPKLEPRILIEDPSKSYGDKHTENMLIYGDNLLALKALEQDFAGKIKCIYNDPPYNSGNAFPDYDDRLEHSRWLNLMKPRIEIEHRLLRDDGSLWISIDDDESHYLKVLCDEIFGRKNFIIQIAIQRGAATGHKAINPTPVQVCDYMLVYAKNKDKWIYNPVYKERDFDKAYSQFISNYESPFEEWKFITLKEAFKNYNLSLDELLQEYPERIIRFAQPDYKGVGQETRNLIDISKQSTSKIFKQNREGYPDIYLYKGNRILFYKDKLKLIAGKLSTAELVTNLWLDMNYQGIANEGGVVFQKSKKPEAQIKRIFEMTTQVGDYVLDSFLGSGTTSAVAHKMNRKWIGIELGEHCHTHCIPRLQKVCDGTDQGGISKAQNWQGGGGFKYYYLAPSLLKQDSRGNWIISKEYNAVQLAAAMAKHEGFRFMPDETYYWKQGKSTEKDFIFTTTNFVSVEFIDTIHSEMKEDESLLICCTAFSKAADKYSNITIKKIPKMLLGRCEFGKEDYSLNIVNLPRENDEPNFVPTGPIASNTANATTKKKNATADLFSSTNGGKK